MCLNRPFADDEGFGDFGIGVPSGDESKDLLFTTCERGETSQFRYWATTGEDGCRLSRDVIQSAAPAAWGRSYSFRDCRDCFRLRREHESRPRGVQGGNDIDDVYFDQESKKADGD